MSRDAALIREIASGSRNALAQHYRHRGDEFGYRLARRIVAEMAAEVTEAHSRRDAYEMLMRAADRLVMGRDLEAEGAPIFPDVEDLEPLPGVRKAIERRKREEQEIGAADEPVNQEQEHEMRRIDLPHGDHIDLPVGHSLAVVAKRLHEQADELMRLHRKETWPRWRRVLRWFTPSWGYLMLILGFWLGKIG